MAKVGRDQYGLPCIEFSLGATAGKKFGKVTGENIGKLLTVVLNDEVLVLTVIKSEIRTEGQITGSFSLEEARELSENFRAGALPAGIRFLEERSVGPSLGFESAHKGYFAGIVGLIVVIVFMVGWYKVSGLNAVVALVLNMVIIFGFMAGFKAVLTLPGIAGLILIIGMAVDANVLIFERIKEELRIGKTVRSAVDGGFKKAFWTIWDANITTFIAAIVLYNYGTGPIKGCAVTLSVGIFASMFTAIFVSKVIFEWLLSRKGKVEKLSISWNT